MRNKHSDLQFIPEDDWRIVINRYFQREEMEDRLAAFCELGKCLLGMNSAQLLFDTDQRHKEEYKLEALMQHISKRLDDILNMLARDSMMRNKNKKCTFPLPKLNPRSHPASNTDEAQEFGKALHDEITCILEIAFKPQEEDDTEIELVYDGSDIPDDTEGRRPRNNQQRNPRIYSINSSTELQALKRYRLSQIIYV